MKKSLIALAVAGTFVAAPAFAATSNVDVYGTIRMSVDHSDVEAADRDRWTINDRVSRFGLKGSEDLGGGLKAVWQIEQQMSITDPDAANAGQGSAFGGANLRNTFVGVAGGFGTVIVGRHDTPYKLGGSADLFADTAADSQRAGAAGIIGRNGFDTRANGTIAYVSPDFSGFHFAAAIIPGEEAATGNSVGTPANNDANGLMDSYSLLGVYANGPLKATLAHEQLGKDALGTTYNQSATKFNISYKIGDIGLGYTYERSKDGRAAAIATGVAPATATTFAIPAVGATAENNTDNAHLASVSYGMGPITLAAQYGMFNNKEENSALAGVHNDLTRWTVGAIYSLSKRTNVYAAYNMDDAKNTGAQTADVKTLTMGVNTSF